MHRRDRRHRTSMTHFLFAFILGMSLFVSPGYAQSVSDTGAILNAGSIRDVLPIERFIGIYVDTNQAVSLSHLEDLPYSNRLIKRLAHGVPTGIVSLPFYCRFVLENDADTTRRFYFFPGYYFRNISLFKDSAGTIVRLPEALPPDGELGCRIFTALPHSVTPFFFKGNLIKANTNWMDPTIIEPAFLSTYFKILRFNTVQLGVITFVFCGILLMMIIYSLTNFIQNWKLEYLFYALYGACMMCLFFVKALFYREDQPFYFFFEEYFDYIIQVSGYYFYISFTRRLIGTARNYPGMDRAFRTAQIVLILLLAVYSAAFFYGARYPLINTMENAGKCFLLGLLVFYIVVGFAQRNKLMNYLLAGNLALLLLALLSQFIIFFGIRFTHISSFFNQALFYYELGVVVELVFFLAALAYKTKKELIEKVKIEQTMRLAQEKKEFETKLAVIQAQQDERSRISADMHDELGAGVTAIRLMSELAKRRLVDQSIPEIEKISMSANELMNKMNTIIWSMNATNDSLANLIAYMRAFAIEHFENSSIDCTVEIPEHIPDIEISGEKRRNIFLVVKEALNNAMKHSKTSRLLLKIMIEDELRIEIHDFGQGIQTEKMRQFSNGLTNMQRRMESIGGTIWIKKENGTVVGLSCPY